MNITGTTKLAVISKSTSQSKDGQNTYYKLGVLSGSEAGMISCSKDIFDVAETGKSYEFETVYNDAYKSFRLNRLLTVSK